MSVEYYLIDKEREELHALWKNSAWSSFIPSVWETEESLFRALLEAKRYEGKNHCMFFYRSLWAAEHGWSVLRGFSPRYNVSCPDRFVVFSDELFSGLEAVDPDNSWPTVWDSYMPGEELRDWIDGPGRAGLFEAFETMES